MDLKQIKKDLARNLSKLMQASEDLKSQLAPSKRSGVGQTTISNYLREDYVGSPSIGKIEKLARAFGLEAWHLIHPTMGDREFTAHELALYRRLRKMVEESADSPKP